MDEMGREMRCPGVWVRGRCRVRGNALACAGIHSLLGMGKTAARGGKIDEEQGSFGILSGFRVICVLTLWRNPRCGAVTGGREFAAGAAACRRYGDKAGG